MCTCVCGLHFLFKIKREEKRGGVPRRFSGCATDRARNLPPFFSGGVHLVKHGPPGPNFGLWMKKNNSRCQHKGFSFWKKNLSECVCVCLILWTSKPARSPLTVYCGQPRCRTDFQWRYRFAELMESWCHQGPQGVPALNTSTVPVRGSTHWFAPDFSFTSSFFLGRRGKYSIRFCFISIGHLSLDTQLDQASLSTITITEMMRVQNRHNRFRGRFHSLLSVGIVVWFRVSLLFREFPPITTQSSRLVITSNLSWPCCKVTVSTEPSRAKLY